MGSLKDKDPSTMNRWELEQLEQELKMNGTPVRKYAVDYGFQPSLAPKKAKPTHPHCEDCNSYHQVGDCPLDYTEDDFDTPKDNEETSMDALIDRASEAEESTKWNSKSTKPAIKASIKKVQNHYEIEEKEESERGFMRDENRVESTYRPRRPRGVGFRSRQMF